MKMGAVPVTIVATIYPKDKSVKPYPATIVGYANITGLEVGGGPILPPDECPPVDPPNVIWGGNDPFPGYGLPEPPIPPIDPPAGGSTTDSVHAGWNFNDGKNPEYPNTGWYFVYIPDEGEAQPKKRR
jgi:hypothetical protein